MSIVSAARRHGKVVFLIGLDREDIDQLIGGGVVSLEAKAGFALPDFAIYAGETKDDLEKYLKEMEGNDG